LFIIKLSVAFQNLKTTMNPTIQTMKKILLFVLMSCGLASVQANTFYYDVTLDGPSEFPPNGSPGIGFGTVSYNDVSHLMSLNLSFSGLTGNTTASHIHAATTTPFAGTAGVATTTPTFAGFPLGVTAGTNANTLDLTLASSYNPSYVTANGGTTAGAEAALFAAMQSGRAYWNVHSSTFGGGEIRGFLVVPEPSSLSLASMFAVGMAVRAWKRKGHSN
jgi:hypothetical protein